MVKKRNAISGQFSALLIEMLESPARQVLTLTARKILDFLEIELAHHGGNDNGNLIFTYEQLVAFGIDRHSIAPALRELGALGFIRITVHGRGGNAEHRQPNLFLLTYAYGRDSKTAPPTHDWRKVKNIEDAKEIQRVARAAKDPAAVARGKRAAVRAAAQSAARIKTIRSIMLAPDSDIGQTQLPELPTDFDLTELKGGA
jgi:hypothetical protein